ncbi:hypothetical protein ACTQWG_18200 [Blautia sp. HCP3S3_H10_1]|uniref:hypothetical protein n=1 Tax=unclassified Blautia TaxID=2648079 RepID=UPI003F91B041|nr:hypothetical protein [Clostridia bacterium]
MKDIIIFEDSLENTVAYVEKLNEMSLVSKICILLYSVNTEIAQEKINDLKGRFPEKTHIEAVNLWNYEERLDDFYSQKNTLFLFDMNLNGDGSTRFNNRINVMYAKKKRELDSGRRHPKIWFYTTTKAEQRAVLLEQFPECTLQVSSMGKKGVLLDFTNTGFMQALEDDE